ncbi:MAG: VOC family protein [Hyphomicrobiales bacterium]
MSLRIFETSIFCEDHTKLAPFYQHVIGLPVAGDEGDAVVFGSMGTAVLLVGSHSEVRGAAKEPARQIPSLLSDDVRGDYDRLVEKGVEFLGPPAVQGPATFVTFRDPEGNLVNILQFDQA